MAKQANSKALAEYELINVWFSDKEKAEFEAWYNGAYRAVEDSWLEIVEAGFKISVSHDGYNDTFVGALTAKKPPGKHLKNKVFVVRHSDFTKLCSLVDYLFVVLLDKGTQAPADQRSDIDW